MKKYDNVPDEILAALQAQKEERAALAALNKLGKKKCICTLPVRVAKMNILRGEKTNMEMVIVPATDIYASPEAFFDGGQFLDRNGMSYFIADTLKAFPLGHVYTGSGHICLGNIFVPAKVPIHSPQEPLETLFLHNDRRLSHGGASLILDGTTIQSIKMLLLMNGVDLCEEILQELKSGRELLSDDLIWKISVEVQQQKPLLDALNLMSQVYDLIFRKKDEEDK